MEQDPTALTREALDRESKWDERLQDARFNLVEAEMRHLKELKHAHFEAVTQRFADAQLAILQRDTATNKRLELQEETINEMKSRLDAMQGKGSGVSQVWGVIVALAGIVIAAVALYRH